MITTVDIDKDLRLKAKLLALNRNTSFKKILHEALKLYLQRVEVKESKK